MKTLTILMSCLIINVANADDWTTVGDFNFNTTTKEFWNNKLFVGGFLNNDQTIASLQTNDTVELINELNAVNEIAIDQEPVSLYNVATVTNPRRATRSEVIDDVCLHFNVGSESWECDNIRKIAVATFGMVMRKTAHGEQVKITGFGNFGLRKQNARGGRNPKTGEPIEIPAIRRVTFHPSPTYACIVDLDGGAADRSICEGTSRDEDYLLKIAGTDLKSGAGDEGFTATTNLKPPPPVVRVTTTVDPNKGTISPSNDYYEGSKMALNVLPKSGWRFSGWTNPQCASGITPNTPITCEPTFVKLNKLTFNVVGNGVVRDDNYKILTELYVEAGKQVILNPLESLGWKRAMPTFTPAPCGYSFIMPDNDLVCTATFIKI